VTVDGVVRDAWSVPLVPYHVYRIEDRTGDVTVLSESGRVPAPGARVQVTGRVEDVASVGGRSIGLHIRQSRLHVYRDSGRVPTACCLLRSHIDDDDRHVVGLCGLTSKPLDGFEDRFG